MKKLGRKLTLERQTLRTLTTEQLRKADGGMLAGAGGCSARGSGCSTNDDSNCCDMPSYGAPCYTDGNAYQTCACM